MVEKLKKGSELPVASDIGPDDTLFGLQENVTKRFPGSAIDRLVSQFSQQVDYEPGTAGFRFKRTLHSKDAPFNCKADGVTDDTAGLLLLFATSRALGGRCEIVIDDGIHGCAGTLRPTSNTIVRFVGSLKCLANPGDNLDCMVLPVNGASNVVIDNPQIDLNSQPAMNGFMFRTGQTACVAYGGSIVNAVRGVSAGGRGFILESDVTSLPSRGNRVIGTRVSNCYMGFAIRGGEQINKSMTVVSGPIIDNCDVGMWLVGNTAGYPHDPEEMQGIVIAPVFRNCGKNTQFPGQDGVVAMDRASNFVVTDATCFNTPEYGKVDSVIRGNSAKTRIDMKFFGDCGSAVSFSPYKESSTVVPFENTVQDSDISVHVHGSADDFIKNTATTANYVVRSSVKGSATAVVSARAVPSNFVSFASLLVDIVDRTQNSCIRGMADQVGSLLFSALPGKKIDMELGRIGALDMRGDLTISTLNPGLILKDLSTGANSIKIMRDGDILTINAETIAGSGVFDRPLAQLQDGSFRLFTGGTTKLLGTAAGISLPVIGNYANDAAAAAGTPAVPVGGVYRNGNILQIRVS